MVKYDPNVIYAHVSHLYRVARWIIFQYIFFSVCIGLFLGWGIDYLLSQSTGFFTFAIPPVATFFGYSHGNQQAFRLKLEAQKALCYLKIEENTRSHF